MDSRGAAIGSSFVARCAGMYLARTATPSKRGSVRGRALIGLVGDFCNLL